MRTCIEEELVEVVADDGIGERVLKIVTREEAQKNRELTWTSQAIVSVDGYELVTLRGNGNRNYPKQWELGTTESRRAGESHEEAVRYGLAEELLIPIEEQGRIRWLFNIHYRNPNDTKDWKNVAVYRYFHTGNVRHDPGEIAAALLLKPKDIGWAIKTGILRFTPMNVCSYEQLTEKGVFG